MEVFFEILLELVLEGSMELSVSRKTPKFLRYLLIVLLSAFCIAVIGLIFYAGALAWNKSMPAGLLLMLLGALILVLGAVKFKKAYLTKKGKS